MRLLAIAAAAITMSLVCCAGELAQRPAAQDPTSPATAEAPMHPPPTYAANPLWAHQVAPKPVEKPTRYTCPMHPEVHATQPGKCPKCGMALVGEP